MPRITIHPDKDNTLVVCCDDDDCVEIIVSGNSDGSGSSGGSGGTTHEPDIGGYAFKRVLTYTVALNSSNPYEHLSQEVIATRNAFTEALTQYPELALELAIVLPSGAPLKLHKLKEIVEDLNADINVSFSRDD